MKKVLLFSMFLILGISANAINPISWNAQLENDPKVVALSPEMAKLSVNEFLAMTPNKYKEMTGEKLGLKKTLQLKAAQKMLKVHMKSGAEDIEKGLYIVLVIVGWGFLAMGLMDDWEGKNWWMNLILTALCWLPGVIHGFIKMKDYYS